MKKNGENVSGEVKQMKELGDKIDMTNNQIRELEEKI